MTESKIFNVLFLCTGNSSRSIMAEAMLNTLGKGRFRAYSAGSRPTGTVNAYAIEQIQRLRYPLSEPRSKSWEEFAHPGAPHMDFVITVCDSAAGEICPSWPGQPITAHWSFQDPAAFEGNDEQKRLLFAKICREIKTRLDFLCVLPVDKLSRLAIKHELDQIGGPISNSINTSKEDTTMANKVYNVLFLCTGNSARSVMSEALVTILGKGRFQGYSAGSKPTGRVNPFALEQIRQFDPQYSTEGMRSKSWDEFATPDAPTMDVIVTVCDNAAGEECPYWPGRPATAHWSYEDPAAVEGTDSDKRAAFAETFSQIKNRMEAFVALPIETMEADAIRLAAKKIGEIAV